MWLIGLTCSVYEFHMLRQILFSSSGDLERPRYEEFILYSSFTSPLTVLLSAWQGSCVSLGRVKLTGSAHWPD